MNRKAESKRQQRLYGITLEEKEKQIVEQGGVCAICGRPPGKKNLSTDHAHSYRYIKIVVERGDWETSYMWRARFIIREQGVSVYGQTYLDAVRQARRFIKRESVRGQICWTCNTALQKFRDNPDLMDKSAAYIRKFLERKVR